MSLPASRLAGLLRWLLLTLAAAAAAWFTLWAPASPAVATIGALCILFGHAWVLAAEFVLLACVHGNDPALRASPVQLLRAWILEVLDDVRVFGWRQPFAWRAEPDRFAANSGKRGIVFVHGFVCNRGFWTPWLRRARVAGHPFVAVNLEPVFGPIDDTTGIVERAVARMTASTGAPPLLVCHSMGGLVARAWLRVPGAASRVAHVVTIGSPHAGAWIARFSGVPNGRQMRIGSRWLHELGAPPAAPGFTCWYSNCDNVVFPASTATLPGADNRLLTGAGHIDLAFRPEVMDHTFALARAL